LFSEKAKPSERVGRKEAGLLRRKTAELPKDEYTVSSAFLLKRPLWKPSTPLRGIDLKENPYEK
jgi:hypothetical protein